MIYFDHSATTPVDKKVLKAMLPYFKDKFGNASSIHAFGQEALAGVDIARGQIASFLNCEPENITFTSGATESNNLALKGLVKSLRKTRGNALHIITTKIEHDAILEPCAELEREGIEVSYAPVDNRGIVIVDELKKMIRENTVLVSVMYVNSEVGAIQPIREIGKIIRKINEKKEVDWRKLGTLERGDKPQSIYFHTDATQAANYLNCDVKWNYIDLLSLSAHKIYGPKGVGILYRRSNTPLSALQLGGHHERNLRSGTLNVPGIVGLGAAVALLGTRREKGKPTSVQSRLGEKISELRDYLIDELKKNCVDIILNTDTKSSTPGHAHFTFLGAEGESILMSLDLEDIAVSTGSACASGSLKPSHVLLAMGIKEEISHQSIRFTLGKYNTKEEVEVLLEKMQPILSRLRKMNPLY